MNKEKIEATFVYMKLIGEKLIVENENVLFVEFQDLKDFFIKYDKITGEEIVCQYDNIFNLKFIHSFKGLFKIKSYCLSNAFKYNHSLYNKNDDYITITLTNGLMDYDIEIKTYNKVFVKKK